MLLLVLLLLARHFTHTIQDCVIDHRTPVIVWEQQIHENVLQPAAYDPVCNQTELFEVSLRFTLKSFELDSEESLFHVYSWVHMSWTHERFVWEPSEYGGVQETTLTSGLDMWFPSFRVLNSPEVDDVTHAYNVPCTVRHTGRVTCVPAFNDAAVCLADYSAWPYDRQACSLIIVPQDYGYGNVKRIRLSFNKRAITMLGAEYGAEWMIVDYVQTQNGSDAALNMTFVLERYGEGLGAMLVQPAPALAALTLSALVLDPRRPTRALLLAFSALCHVYYAKVLLEMSPHKQASVPRLVLYYRGSLLTAVSALAVSLCVRALYVCGDAVPAVLVRLCACLSTRARCLYVWVPRREGGPWSEVADLVNALCLLVFPLVYLSLYLSYVPQPYGIMD